MKSLGMWAMVCLAAFIIGKTAKTENKEVSDVVLENVEALANPEGNGNIPVGGPECFGLGNVPCESGVKVAYILFDPYGLGDKLETE